MGVTVTAPIDPQPRVYPKCPECDTPWVLRHAVNLFTGDGAWVWQRDCKHGRRKPEPVLVDERPKKGKNPTRIERRLARKDEP